MIPRRHKRRAPPPATIAAVLALLSASTGRMSATAFMSADTTRACPSSSASSHARRSVTALSVHDDAPIPTYLETVTDANLHALLLPASGRPVLIDAYSPRCGPCKMLDKVLRQARPRYWQKVDFVKWNVEDKEHTEALRQAVADGGFAVRGLPSLLVFRDGRPVAVRKGFANEFQLDYFLEGALPDVLERTFDEDGIKMVPLPAGLAAMQEGGEDAVTHCDYVAEEMVISPECGDGEVEERSEWGDRATIPAMEGISSPPGWGSR